ncbi:MAG: serpin family protein [Saprospiraceae bacterium]|nr:serpin family protein [Saprospiraceae bacterium]
MKNLTFFLLFCLILSCEKTITNENIGFQCSDNAKVCDLAYNNNDFGFGIFSILHDKSKEENLFISPFSISTALSMTLNGAVDDTKQEMLNSLKYFNWNPDSLNSAYRDLINLLPVLDKEVKMNNANSIWYRDGFSVLPEFLIVNNKYFSAEIKNKDFSKGSTITEINTWVENKTEGKIKDIINSIDPSSVMFLINAIYFKGQWKYKFDKKNTTNEHFYLENGNTTEVEMMHGSEMNLPYFRNEKFSMVDIPYGDSVFSMTLILPEYNYKVDDVIKELNINSWENIKSKMSTTKIDIGIPKFKMEYKEYLKPFLKKLGILKAFQPGIADFSKINGYHDLYIDEVIHQSYVEIDEAGTEASAATVVVINVTSAGNSFIANRPFIFLIRENKTNSILFIGKVMNPNNLN